MAHGTPLSVIGGYLGSGKTTLLNELLSSDGSSRVVCIVNDFGTVNIDASLVRSRSGDTLELTNGCICCDLADGMAATLERVSALQPPADHIMVEVSGVGDPRAVARWGHYPQLRPGTVVVCCDVTSVHTRAADRWVGDTVHQQLRSADVLLLTKTDLAPPGDVEAVRRWLNREFTTTPVSVDRRGVIERLLATPDERGREESADVQSIEAVGETHRSLTVTTDELVDLTGLVQVLSRLPATVVRAKGVLRTTDAPATRTVVQWSGTGEPATATDGPWDGLEQSVLVVIWAGPEDGDAWRSDLTKVLPGARLDC